MLMELLYHGLPLPANTADDKLAAVQANVEKKLASQLARPLRWHAIASRAVEAGHRIAQKRKRQRRKLAQMLDRVRAARGLAPISRPEGWEEVNLVYGYGAVKQENLTRASVMFIAAKTLGIPQSQLEAMYAGVQ